MDTVRAKSIVLEQATQKEALALWRIDLLQAADIVARANRWLAEGLDNGSIAIACLAGEAGDSMIDIAPMFERALEEMELSPSDLAPAVRISPTLEFFETQIKT